MSILPLYSVLANDDKALHMLGVNTTRFVSYELDSYTRLITLVKNLVGSECWAAVIDEKEVLFNEYDTSRSFKQILADSMARNALLHDPYTILMHFYCSQKNHTMNLYMFGPKPWMVQFVYIYEKNEYTAAVYLSD